MKRTTLLRSVSSVVLVVLALTACGSNNDGSNPGAGGNPAPSPSVSTVAAGKLTVGSCLDYPPFEDIKKGQLPTGFDVDMVDAIATKLNLQVKWVKANFNTIFNAVSAHKFDMVAAASTITAERKKVVNFSEPYFSALLSLTINKDKTPTITSTDQLKKGDIVGVQKGTTTRSGRRRTSLPGGLRSSRLSRLPIRSATSKPGASPVSSTIYQPRSGSLRTAPRWMLCNRSKPASTMALPSCQTLQN